MESKLKNENVNEFFKFIKSFNDRVFQTKKEIYNLENDEHVNNGIDHDDDHSREPQTFDCLDLFIQSKRQKNDDDDEDEDDNIHLSKNDFLQIKKSRLGLVKNTASSASALKSVLSLKTKKISPPLFSNKIREEMNNFDFLRR